jgi:hypothetical protein
MDLNINNYSVEELYKLFNITDNKIDIIKIEDYLSKTISLISIQDNDDLPENKEKLIKFYTKAAFKIFNSNIKNNNSMEIDYLGSLALDSTNSLNLNDANPANPANDPNNINYFKENEEIISALLENNTNFKSNLLDDEDMNPQSAKKQLFVKGYLNKYTEGLVNPLERETTSSILSINSKFRESNSKSSTDFVIELNDPYHNVVSIKLASIELINSYYTISEYLRTNKFSVNFFQYNSVTNDISQNSIFTEDFTIPDGNYSVTDLETIINNDCFKNNETNGAIIPSIRYYRVIKIVKTNNTGKLLFVVNDSSGNQPLAGYKWGFDLNFSDKITPNRPAFLNLGWILGYRKLNYNFFKTINNETYYNHVKTLSLDIGFNPESTANTIGTRYFLLEVDDFNKNQSKLFRFNAELKNNSSEAFTYSVSNILALIPNRCNYYDTSFEDYTDRIFNTKLYFGPVKISKLKIRLLDENGVVVNLNNTDLTINIAIESINKHHNTLSK